MADTAPIGSAPIGSTSTTLSVLRIPAALTALFCALPFLTPARDNPKLLAAFLSAAGVLIIWQLLLYRAARSGGRRLTLEFVPVKAHYVQATLHLSIFAYWGLFWDRIYAEAYLIVSQIVFLYVFDMLLGWTRRGSWRFGFGPFPIIFSTNLFLWFRDDWFFLQFLMIATGALGKEFIRWERDGRKTHIFNPSALSLSVFSIVLLIAGASDITWGEEIATTLNRPPYIYVGIFFLGLIVQFLFGVTLVTLAAAAALVALNLLYSGATGTYFFIDSNIPIAVFLGLHLLVTDPSTSPRSNAGKVIFGGMYGAAVFVLYGFLEAAGSPSFYDKLLCVPFLNLSVRWIDRVARAAVPGNVNLWVEGLSKKRANFIHMGIWIGLFTVLFSTGFVGGNHKGGTLEFWEQAVEEDRPGASRRFIRLLNYHASEGSREAMNQLGVIYSAGKIVPADPGLASVYFGKAADLGFPDAAANIAIQFLFHGRRFDPQVGAALDLLEAGAGEGSLQGQSAYLLGIAYANGAGRDRNLPRALELFETGSGAGSIDASVQAARAHFEGRGVPVNPQQAAVFLERAAAAGHGPSHFFLARLYFEGRGVPRDVTKARALLETACSMGVQEACEALRQMPR